MKGRLWALLTKSRSWASKTQSYFELNVPDRKVEEMCALARRIRFSGVPFQHRVLLCGSLIMSKILCGIEVNDLLHAQQERTLRSALGHAIWTKTDKARNPG